MQQGNGRPAEGNGRDAGEAPERGEMMYRRLEEFQHALLRLASQQFDVAPRITGEDDMLDAVAAGIMMLGEELRASTVSRAYLDEVLGTMLDMLFVLAPNGEILQANHAVTDTLGYDADALVGRDANELFARDANPVAPLQLGRLIASTSQTYKEAVMLAADDTEIPVLLSMSVMRSGGAADHGARIVVVARDVTEQSRTHAALERANLELERTVAELERRTHDLDVIGEMGEVLQSCHTVDELFEVAGAFLKRLFPNLPGMLSLTTPSGVVVETRVSWSGFPKDTRQRVFAPEACWALRRGRAHEATVNGGGVRCGHVPDTYEGSYVCVPMLAQSESMGILHLRTSSAGEAFGTARTRLAHTVAEHIGLAVANISLRETLRNQSIRDPLTGLFNRRYMEETLDRELHRAARGEQTLGYISLDIDNFKSFNDTFGHEAGDLVLREVAAVLAEHTRGEDVACRPGGEEFAVILIDASAEETANRAEDLRQRIKSLDLQYRKQGLRTVTVSCGVAAFPSHGGSMADVMRSADAALYRAKAEGRDRTVVAQAKSYP
jgi:diguanylate cyclase (GGDEF)-like protein/PAS domain S-box-containing protein